MDGSVGVVYLGIFAGAIVLGTLELIWVARWMRLRFFSSPGNGSTGFTKLLFALALVLLIFALMLSKTGFGFDALSYVVIAEFVLAITINLIQRKQVPST